MQDHAQNLEEQLWMEGRGKVSIIYRRPVTSRDLKEEGSLFSSDCPNISATGCSSISRFYFASNWT